MRRQAGRHDTLAMTVASDADPSVDQQGILTKVTSSFSFKYNNNNNGNNIYAAV